MIRFEMITANYSVTQINSIYPPRWLNFNLFSLSRLRRSEPAVYASRAAHQLLQELYTQVPQVRLHFSHGFDSSVGLLRHSKDFIGWRSTRLLSACTPQLVWMACFGSSHCWVTQLVSLYAPCKVYKRHHRVSAEGHQCADHHQQRNPRLLHF